MDSQTTYQNDNVERRSRHGTRRILTLLKIELLIELAALLGIFFSAFLVSMRQRTMGFTAHWHLADGLLAIAFVMLLFEAYMRSRAGRMQKLQRRVIIFGAILLGYLAFLMMTRRLHVPGLH